MCPEYRGIRTPETSGYISGRCGHKYTARDGSLCGSNYKMDGQRVIAVACSVAPSDRAGPGEYFCGVDVV